MACSPWQVNKVDFFPRLSNDRKLLCERGFMGSYIKVILLYKRSYWIEKGFSGEVLTDCLDSPLMTAFDDTKHNEKGETQPALIVFVAGYMYRTWKDRKDF
jgi:monoamine oxidase